MSSPRVTLIPIVFRPDTNRPATLERKDALLDAAIALLGERGLQGVTHRAVAAKAGLPQATTSYFFASIDELMLAAMRRDADKMIADLHAAATAAADQADPAEALNRLVDVLLAEPEATTIAQFETYLEAARRPELRPDIDRVLDAFEELTTTILRRLGAPKPESAARAFVALADGFALHRLAARRTDQHNEAFRDALTKLLHGYTRA